MTAITINSFPSLHSFNSPRGWALAIIVLLHAAFFWALTSGLTPKLGKIFETQPPVYLPVPAQPKSPEPVDVREPVIDPKPLQPTLVRPVIDFPVEPARDTTTIFAPEPTVPNDFTGGSAVEPAPVVVEPRIDSRRGLSEPFYPPQVIREGGQGTVFLSIYILADGRVGQVKLDRSSGYAKLDESAMREAKKWRFVPGTSDGKPIAMWKQLPVTFRLNTRM